MLRELWDYAHGWREGAGEWFVWPKTSTIAASFGLTEDAIRRCLRELEARGWIRPDTNEGKRGWWLHTKPTPDDPQLELFAAVPGEPGAVDSLGTDAGNHRAERDDRPDNHRAAASTGTQKNVSELDDDDAQRIWLAYEADRFATLGGPPARTGPPPQPLRALLASHGVAAVETYARRSVALARDARDRQRACANDLIAARSDGREWHPTRLLAVADFRDPPAAVARAAPPPDPVVGGERVSLHEREAFESGGEAAVLAQRRELAERPHAGVAHIDDWLRRMGGGA